MVEEIEIKYSDVIAKAKFRWTDWEHILKLFRRVGLRRTISLFEVRHRKAEEEYADTKKQNQAKRESHKEGQV